ncbi:MAG: excinuclease ABC subunit UvrC [Nanoarchaeota archaeon]
MLKDEIKLLPNEPGVYIFKDKLNNIIYIGKAKNIKNRVSSYFNLKNQVSYKTKFLVKNIKKIEYIMVNNEIEALLLENKLIKKHKPKYNINLKDDKTYAYLKITDEKIPKIISTRKIDSRGFYFGPYTSGFIRREIEKIIINVFKIVNKKTYSSKSKLNYEIGLSPAKRVEEINLEEYKKNVENTKEFLKGNTKKVLTKLQNEMNEASKNQEYEIANMKKKQIEAIKYLEEKQSVDLIKKHNQDVVIYLTNKKDKTLIQIFNILKGVINNKKDYKFDYYDDNLFEEFIKMYYSKNSIPNEIIIEKNFFESNESKNLIEKYLTKKRDGKVIITIPQRGEKYKLIQLALKNAQITFGDKDVLYKIKDFLGLSKIPKIIECFDMSNLGFEHLVGGMTRWVDGQEDKRGFRKYKIKSFSGKNDDYTAMKEVIYRRYKRLKDKNEKLPDLIILDGGKGHLKKSIESLRELKLKIDIIAIAKQEEEIYTIYNKEPLVFEKNSSIMLFLRKVRDRTHNYVISYNRKRREMKLKEGFK